MFELEDSMLQVAISNAGDCAATLTEIQFPLRPC